MSETGSRKEVAASSDAEIAGLISAAVHEPFREVWRRYQEEVWRPLRQTLEEVAAAHERALAAAAASEESGERTDDALEQYQYTVGNDIIEPLRDIIEGSTAAVSLEESLASVARRARAALSELPLLVEAPVSPTSRARVSGAGPIRTIKRACARVLAPLMGRGRARTVPVARLARQHLDQVVRREQARAFRESQRNRAGWLGQLERAAAAWIASVLSPPADDDPAESNQPADGIRAHIAAGEALQAELQGLLDNLAHASGSERGERQERSGALLHASVAVAGTFAADPRSSRPVPGRHQELARRWDAWAQGSVARLELYHGLLAMRRGTDEALRELRAAWGGTVEQADSLLGQIEAELKRSTERAEGLSSAAGRSSQESSLSAALEAERLRTDQVLDRLHDALPDPETLFEVLASEAERAIDGLDAVRSRMPGALALHDLPDPGELPRRPSSDRRTVQLRETALQAFDTLRRERMRTAPSAIREAMHRVRSEVAELREVSGYGYEAALAELTDGGDSGSIHPARLVTHGLSRAGNKAGTARRLLEEALALAANRVTREVEEGSWQLIQQATADRVTAGYLEARTYLTAGFLRGWRRWRGRLAHAGARARAASPAALAPLRRLASSIGLGPAARAASEPDEQTLAFAEESPRGLPVVYRRLFALEPLADARLLAGREDALAAVAAAWARCQAGSARSLVVIASPGAGLTSFLNVAAGRLSEEAPGGVRRTFRVRVREETRLAACLARWLGLEEAGDLDTLAERVLEAPAGVVPDFAVLEAAEHLHMRAPRGSELFRRLLTFLSRTESRVFWMVATTSSAWQLVEKGSPAFAHDLERVRLRELSPEQLRDAVLARHRLSGLPLRYAEPRDGRAVLRRRTRRLRGLDKQGQLVETDYFHRLHRASLGSVRLALFHWLRSADFTAIEGSLLVRPLQPLESGIQGLDSSRGFALKAILDHGTLTVPEYCEVARAPAPESLHLFRALEDHHIIEPVPDARSEGEEQDVGVANRGRLRDRAIRYRIRPIMLGAVAAHLRSRNILH